MSWVNWKKKDEEKPIVKLESLSSFTSSIICTHGNHADSCYLCDREQSKKTIQNRDEFFNSSNQTINLDDQ